ncbi:MAG: AI-2E family transporter [Leptolyngbyaceae cyanobacterium SM1_3_5]|nr:AI-2E family transporter [Leptolyngbyaceae cyanobacterium SM1_3_5]
MKFGQWLGLFALVVSLFILWQFRQTLLLLFTAVVLATAFNRIAQRLQKSGAKRGIALLLTLSLIFFLSLFVILLIVPPFIGQFVQLISLVPAGAAQVLEQLQILNTNLPAWFPRFDVPDFSDFQTLVPILRNFLGQFFGLFGNLINTLAIPLQGLLVIVLTIMMLVNPSAYRRVFLLLFPSFYRRRADEILTRCEQDLGNWAGGVLVSSLCIALLSGVGLWILRIKLVLAQALLAGLLNIIPNIGPTLSLVFPVTVALIDENGVFKAIAAVVLYIIIQQLESYLITPTIMANQVSLLPALTLVSQLFFASIFGFLGLVLALPLTIVFRAWIEEALVKDVLNQWDRDTTRAELVTAPILAIEPADATALPTETKGQDPQDLDE